jgi:hypothetical protein
MCSNQALIQQEEVVLMGRKVLMREAEDLRRIDAMLLTRDAA